MASSIYFTIKIPDTHPELLNEVSWSQKARVDVNLKNNAFVQNVYRLKEWYVAQLQDFLERSFKIKGKRRHGQATSNLISLGLRAFLSTTFFGQLLWVTKEFAQQEGLVPEIRLPFQKKKIDFDLFSMLDNFGVVYNAGEQTVSIKPRWKYWDIRAKWLEYGNVNLPKTYMLSKINQYAEQKWKEINR